jgi:hypothetical protein
MKQTVPSGVYNKLNLQVFEPVLNRAHIIPPFFRIPSWFSPAHVFTLYICMVCYNTVHIVIHIDVRTRMSELQPPAGCLLVPHIIYECGEPQWNAICG